MATASPSSAPEPARASGPPTPSSRDRGQVSPTATLVAVATIGMALSLYATVFAGVLPLPGSDVADPTLERVHDAVEVAGVADPSRLERAVGVGPDGYQLHVSLRAAGRHWAVGPTPPTTSVDTASRRVAVRRGPGNVRSGRLRVVVWR